jgi:hypothetical protein
MTEEMPKYETRRGGKRPGAGRKCKPGEAYLTETFRADNKTLEILSEAANKSAYIRKAIAFYDSQGWREALTEEEKEEVRASIRADMNNVKADINMWKQAFEDKGWEEYKNELEMAKERLETLERILYKF